LHDIFQMPFGIVAQTVGRSVQACRQLATRARQKISDGGGARFDVTSADHRLVTEKFIAASVNGDRGGLLEVLAPDAWGDIDYGRGRS
jgi:RNA polymerase sigma-70 factor, ECF subfamily